MIDPLAPTDLDLSAEPVFVDVEESARLTQLTVGTFRNRVKEFDLRPHGTMGKKKFALRDVLALRRRLAEQDRRNGRHAST